MPGLGTGLRWTAGVAPYRGGGGGAVMIADMFGLRRCAAVGAVETRIGGLDVGARAVFQRGRGGEDNGRRCLAARGYLFQRGAVLAVACRTTVAAPVNCKQRDALAAMAWDAGLGGVRDAGAAAHAGRRYLCRPTWLWSGCAGGGEEGDEWRRTGVFGLFFDERSC